MGKELTTRPLFPLQQLTLTSNSISSNIFSTLFLMSVVAISINLCRMLRNLALEYPRPTGHSSYAFHQRTSTRNSLPHLQP